VRRSPARVKSTLSLESSQNALFVATSGYRRDDNRQRVNPMLPTPSAPSPTRSLPSRNVARNLELLAWLMDRAIKVPGTRITLGLDALLGLIPVGGDILTGLVQAGLVLVALKHYRVPRAVAARMLGNVLLDIGVGAIPLVGDLFDVAFKANTKNLKLLEPYQRSHDISPPFPQAQRPRGPSIRMIKPETIDAGSRGTRWSYLLPIAAILGVALIFMIVGFVTIVRWLLSTS
jgi:hypothetical protein